jgi:malonate-semialdehyde dehydrogenase (acetylating) / methylmalonate-semialdehyde dehydrogenase
MHKIPHFIDGACADGISNRTADVYNPATGEIAAHVLLANQQDAHQAVVAAKQAFALWCKIPPLRRARILFTYKELLERHTDELAQIITREHGKTLADARGSIQRGIEVVEFACGIPHLLKGSFSENAGNDIDCHSVRQPLGVCVGITPFNFPAMVPLWMFPIAIACGNTFILKPSEKDPSCAVRLAELFTEAGLPRGVLNVLQGDKEVVDGLLTHPDVSGVSFVGSTNVAEYVHRIATQHSKRVQALGGAKNHLVVMPDADLPQTVDALMGSAFGSAGERCMAISVAVTVGEIADQLIDQLKPRIAALKIGHGTEKHTEMGPLITQEHLQRVTSYINIGIEEGAKLIVDGRVHTSSRGFFLGGSLFDNVTPAMRIYQEEIFGPVLCVVRVNSFAAALELVNNHPYGNGTAIFTRSGATAREFASRVQAGMVGINIPIPVPVAFHSFGGWKRSLFGDIHMHGPEGVHFYTRLKTVTSRWPVQSEAQFHMPTF